MCSVRVCSTLYPTQSNTVQDTISNVSSDSDRCRFFKFISLTADDDGSSGVQSLSLQAVAHAGCTLNEPGLLQVQAALFAYWLDLAQKSKDSSIFLFSIPDSMWVPHFLRTLTPRPTPQHGV